MPTTAPDRAAEFRRALTPDAAEFDEARRVVRATINTACVDRLKTVILPEGGRFDRYRKNPVVLCNHDGASMPVGRNLSIALAGGRMIAETEFLPAGLDPVADKVCELYRLGFLNAWSIFFDPRPGTFGPPTAAEIRANPAWAEARCVYREWDLLEYSVVTVPGNPEATRAAIARGLALPGWEAPPPPLPSLRGLSRGFRAVEDAALRQLREAIRPEMRRALTDARELARGMV